MSSIRFIMIGGFLGAGKTTTIARLARTYQDQGLKVGIVTNDQATDLVDTHTLRNQGFNVGEVAGACFCCNFNELTNTADQLHLDNKPDVILAEPVGSCTDLVATVVQPLMQLFGDRFDVAPYGVILKPSHGRRILKGDPKAGFSPKAAYIFKKQLEEADFVLINRADELTEAELDELTQLLANEAPDTPLLRISAKTGEGFDAFLEQLEQRGEFGRRILDMDYDVYAEGEAELGWLNMSLTATADTEFDLDALVLDIVDRLQNSLATATAETAHLKTIGLSDGAHAVANLVSSDTRAELSLPSQCKTTSADLVVNARVAIDPAQLQTFVESAVDQACQSHGAKTEVRQTQAFRPGRPVPTHRITEFG
ncbi:GTP-binding protein [Novipirellula caenicola]|uniref:CobW/HypB/UreG nucleotide-binding domain-containing protein n=1 Tax=Novipirellula caenicola TaxID=1536901 RepID=A0ABP9VK11_9BACT